jgi:hypothetical protein
MPVLVVEDSLMDADEMTSTPAARLSGTFCVCCSGRKGLTRLRRDDGVLVALCDECFHLSIEKLRPRGLDH